MTTIDFSPLFRSAIGFDRLASLLESAGRNDAGGYPPYNIEVTGEDTYEITMAVAGFRDAEIEVIVKDNILTVSGTKAEEPKERRYLYRGIANRSFERKFQLADHVRVLDARLKDGLLRIDLAREIPESLKPRRIEVRSEGHKYLEAEVSESRAA